MRRARGEREREREKGALSVQGKESKRIKEKKEGAFGVTKYYYKLKAEAGRS